ncbi:MAG: methyl-accepting chemotaxis protein [Treponema sp.]|jgi:methyl-accepting chemotaxis protein|nr:methyl-accepting chemotaxis protein [Treponema sp.]
MKLNTRFSILFITISLVTIFLPLFILNGEKRISTLNNYKDSLNQLEIQFSNLSAFSTDVLYFGTDLTTLKEDWEEKKTALNEIYPQVIDEANSKVLNNEGREEIKRIKKLWSLITTDIENLTGLYTKLTEYEFPTNSIATTINSLGLRKFITSYEKNYDLKKLIYYSSSIEGSTKTLKISREGFSIVFSRFEKNIDKQIKSLTEILYMIGLTLALSVSILIFLIANFSTRIIVTRIKRLQNEMSSMANKNLVIKYESKVKDEIGDLARDLTKAAGILDTVLKIVKHDTAKVQESGTGISHSIIKAAESTNEISLNSDGLVKQMESVSDTVGTCMKALNQMNTVADNLIQTNQTQSSLIKENDDSINDIAAEIQTITDTAIKRSENAKEMQSFIKEGDEKVTSTSDLLSEINGKLDEVSEVITLINSVAEQTNLLSMNAAIESAHAGEAGKGFAVVAEEIRALAETTKENSDTITKSISEIVEQVRTADVTSAEASKAFIKVREKSETLIVSLQDIATGIQAVETKSLQITDRTKELGKSSEEVNGYSNDLSKHQTQLTQEMNNLSNIMSESKAGIGEIRLEISDISKQMNEIRNLSSENNTRMGKLSATVNEFVTSDTSTTGQAFL